MATDKENMKSLFFILRASLKDRVNPHVVHEQGNEISLLSVAFRHISNQIPGPLF